MLLSKVHKNSTIGKNDYTLRPPRVAQSVWELCPPASTRRLGEVLGVVPGCGLIGNTCCRGIVMPRCKTNINSLACFSLFDILSITEFWKIIALEYLFRCSFKFCTRGQWHPPVTVVQTPLSHIQHSFPKHLLQTQKRLVQAVLRACWGCSSRSTRWAKALLSRGWSRRSQRRDSRALMVASHKENPPSSWLFTQDYLGTGLGCLPQGQGYRPY